MMARTLLALLGLLVCGALATGAADDVTKKLTAARAEYDAKTEAAEAAVTKWFEKRETAARAAGDKKALDQLSADRAGFTEFGIVPRTAPDELRKQLTGARTTFEGALLLAIMELTRLKRDEEAASVEGALLEFRKTGWKHIDTSKATFKDDYLRLAPNTEVPTLQKFAGGFEVVVVARTELENIRLRAQRGSVVIFNWELNPRELRVHRPDGAGRPESGSIATAKVTPLKPNTWYTLKWRMTEDGTQVWVDGKSVFEEQKRYELTETAPVVVRSMRSVVDLKEFHVYPLEKKR
jgi:hypothetical protein